MTRAIHQPLIGEIAEAVAREYDIRAADIIVSRSPHTQARKVLIELAYRLCLDGKTLKELGEELGGISGAGIAKVHERFQRNIRDDKELGSRILKIEGLLCQ